MSSGDLLRMLFLAAAWGASFPLMRACIDQFGALPIALVRVLGGFLCLAPLLFWKNQPRRWMGRWKSIALVGVFNSAIPFLCYSYASASITAGLASVFNSTTPLWGALIARVWLGDKLKLPQFVGLLLGFAGVVYLAWDSAAAKAGVDSWQVVLAIAACLLATACYGLSGNYTKKYLSEVPPLVTAAGSLLAASAVLFVPAAQLWPSRPPTLTGWWCVAGLAVGCTGVAYVVFYQVLANAGPTRAMAVSYLIPLFANLWSWLFLGEPPNSAIFIGCLTILLGTSLTTGIASALMLRLNGNKTSDSI
jgi:drug/metabolite transporter (DMT)-like permease